MHLRNWLAIIGLTTACGSTTSHAPPSLAPPAPPAQPPAASPVAAAPRASTKPRPPAFDNPGGMWLPAQMPEHAQTLRGLGLAIDPASLADPTKAPLGAIVSLGGCSGSFVSPEGLVVTNHHCVQGALQYNSTPEDNLIENGFLAQDRAAERPAGPGSRLQVVQAVVDVTAAMTDGLAAIPDDRARKKELELREKQLTAACEKGRPGVRCRIESFFGGGQWTQIESLEIRDVRLVYAPARSIGNFGGEVDNWRWPRHTGDFSFYRAYVGKDGRPADYAAENVPYEPPHWLRPATEPLEEGDLVVVAGYPGRTQRLFTAEEAQDAAEWSYPRRNKIARETLAVIDTVTAGQPELVIKAEPRKRGINNYLTKDTGQLEALVGGGLVAVRKRRDAALAAWVEADPARKAKYGPALAGLGRVLAEQRARRETDATRGEIMAGSLLLGSAMNIVRMAEERPKADLERQVEYQERNWERLAHGLVRMQKSYARELDRALFRLALVRAAALPKAAQPEILAIIVGKGKRPSEKTIDAALDKLYEKTSLEDTQTRLELFQNASIEGLRRSKDPFIQLALLLRPAQQQIEDRDDAVAGALLLYRPHFVAALREMGGGLVAPDANGTLRLTYATVKGPPDGGRGFTTVSEMLKKVTGHDPFDAPALLVSAVKSGQWGRFAASALGEVPIDFMSDVDTTGGNSGSATLNRKGEIVGLLFDGTYESVAADWMWLHGKTRSIHVDMRYVYWIMVAVDGASALLVEMGVEPRL
jgi:hypothetical protein